MDNLANKSLGVFHEGFEDWKKRVKELLDFVATLLILGIGVPVADEATTVANDTIEEATGVQDIDAPANNPLPTTSKAAIVAEALGAPMGTQLEALANQAIEVWEPISLLFVSFSFSF